MLYIVIRQKNHKLQFLNHNIVGDMFTDVKFVVQNYNKKCLQSTDSYFITTFILGGTKYCTVIASKF